MTRLAAGIGLGRRVLVILDGNRGPYLAALRDKGFGVEVVRHGSETLAALLREIPSAVIIEWPGRNDKPISLLRTVREYLGLTTLPIILLVGGAPDAWRKAAQSYGIVRELRLPPISPMEVVASVAESLSIPLYPSRPKPALCISKNVSAHGTSTQVIGPPAVTGVPIK